MLRILVPALVLLVAAILLLPRHVQMQPPEAATVLPEDLALPDVELVDTAGRSFSLAELDDYGLLFFGYTNCPDICPLTMQTLASAEKNLRDQAPNLVPRVMFVSIDPHRDTLEKIASYVRVFDPSFSGFTADEETIAPLLAALGVTVHKTETDGGAYNVVHNGTVFVIAPGSKLIALFGGSSHEASTIASDFLRIRRQHQTRTRR